MLAGPHGAPGRAAGGRRCFLALWPDPALAEALAGVARAVAQGGHPVDAPRIHLTLLFAGRLDAAGLEGLLAAGERIARVAAPVDILLDHLVWWPGPRVLSAQPGAASPALTALGKACRSAGEALGLAVDARPFAPHVTLARGGSHDVATTPLVPCLCWRAADLRLVESVQDAARTYRVLGRWGLAGD